MGREIKFRGKTIESAGLRQAGEWAYGGYFMDDCYGGCPEGKHYIVEWNSTGMGYFAHTKVERETVGQYTGLKDKNSKEIYEGDIVKYLDGGYSYSEGGRDEWEEMNIGVIVYDDENAMFDVTNKNCVDREDVFEGGGDFEVIGNIYENPELLGVQDE